MEKHYKNESERYHDELTQIDHLVQKVRAAILKYILFFITSLKQCYKISETNEGFVCLHVMLGYIREHYSNKI